MLGEERSYAKPCRDVSYNSLSMGTWLLIALTANDCKELHAITVLASMKLQTVYLYFLDILAIKFHISPSQALV